MKDVSKAVAYLEWQFAREWQQYGQVHVSGGVKRFSMENHSCPPMMKLKWDNQYELGAQRWEKGVDAQPFGVGDLEHFT